MFIKVMHGYGEGALKMREENYRELDWGGGVGSGRTRSFEQSREQKI